MEERLAHLNHNKRHMTDIYLKNSDEEGIVDFVKDQKELYYKTNERFKDKARKDGLWERFVSSHNLSEKVCKTKITCYQRFTQSKSGQAPKEMTEAELDSVQIKLLEDTHQKEGTQQIFRVQYPAKRSKWWRSLSL